MKRTIALLIFSVSISAHAFTLNYDTTNKKTYNPWSSNTVTFDYDFSACPTSLSTDVLTGAVDAALNAWNGVPTSALHVTRGAQISRTAAAQIASTTPGNPVIVCDTNYGTDTGLPADQSPAAAKILLVNGDWDIISAVLLLNNQAGAADNIANIPVNVLSLLMAHEIGHALGLGHSSDPNALMYYDASLKTQLNLSKDDMDGISYLYPRDELGHDGIFGCNTVERKGDAPRGGPGGSAGAVELGALMFAAWVATRSRFARFRYSA